MLYTYIPLSFLHYIGYTCTSIVLFDHYKDINNRGAFYLNTSIFRYYVELKKKLYDNQICMNVYNITKQSI